MAQISVLRQELAEYQKAITKLNDEIRAIQGFIAVDERNLQHAVEAVRLNAQQSLENYRLSLAVKQVELQNLLQAQRDRQQLAGKLEEANRKEQEVQLLERERLRIISLYDKARTDLDRIEGEIDALTHGQAVAPAPQASAPAPSEFILAGGQHLPLPAAAGDFLIGCKDAGDAIFPDVDLTPYGGTSSGVSRRHATISFKNGQWTIRDENSTNGTFVDETRLAPYVPRPLTNHAQIRFGTINATFSTKPSSATPPAGPTRRLA